MSTTPPEVAQYIAALPDDARKTIETLRAIVREAVPEAVEGFSYQMPAFNYRGRPLVYCGAWKAHCALYGPAIEPFAERLGAYRTSKGTVQFPLGEPLPEALIRELLLARAADIDAAAAQRGRNRSRARSA